MRKTIEVRITSPQTITETEEEMHNLVKETIKNYMERGYLIVSQSPIYDRRLSRRTANEFCIYLHISPIIREVQQ